MVVCQICGLKEGEWQCSVCKRVICTDHAVPTKQGVFCTDDAPQKNNQAQAQAKKTGQTSSAKGLLSLFITLLALTIGLALIVFIGQSFIDAAASQSPVVEPFANAMKSGGILIIIGMGALTALIGVAWLVARRSRV